MVADLPAGADAGPAVGRAARMIEVLIGVEPFRRLVLAEMAVAAADALFTVSLAGSLFFSVSVDAARPRVLVYLLLTLAPFTLVAPFVGPIVDRLPGGQRVVIAASCAGRAVVSVLLASHLTTLLFFPEAFAVLVFRKTSSVAKSALVPRLVADETKLVAANAQLSRMTAVVGGVGLAAGASLLNLSSSRVVLIAATVGYAGAALIALRIPRARTITADPLLEEVELHGGALRLAANAMSVLRATVGFLSFLLAFNLKTAAEPKWIFGLAIAAGGAGAFAGTFLAAFGRRRVKEETLLTAALAAPGVLALLGAIQYRRSSPMVAAFALGVGASVGRQVFNSLAQRLAPDAEKGRAFARFETQFQLAWVIGALLPVLASPSSPVGLSTLGIVLSAAGVVYSIGLRALQRHDVVVRTGLDPGQDDPPASMLALASALHAQGAERMAVLTAIGAVRAARASTADPNGAGPELEALWREAAIGTTTLPSATAELAIRLARRAVHAACDSAEDPASPPSP